uniref:Restriction endonuclease n=1 Tax=Pithovirus LCPAC406 TaxID=2506599 RepID=A0A481ZDQ0_9VIRU|nr:MAG: restriction endonuclease [Pithovirus LCPAC406]
MEIILFLLSLSGVLGESACGGILPKGFSCNVLLLVPIVLAVCVIGITCWKLDSRSIHLNNELSRQLNRYNEYPSRYDRVTELNRYNEYPSRYDRATGQYDIFAVVLGCLTALSEQSNKNYVSSSRYIETSARYDNFSFRPIRVSKRSKGEAECILVLELLFNTEFHTVRPFFLKFPETCRNLELDCYNSELRLAIEYNGRQHYKWPNFPNVTKEQFYSQCGRDCFKVKRCNEYGIYLIIVPYTIKLEDIYGYILTRIPYTLRNYIVVE